MFLTNGASQPYALPVLSCPVLSLQPGSLQVRLRASMLSRTQAGKSPGLRFQVAGSSVGASRRGLELCPVVWGEHCWGCRTQRAPEGCWQPNWSQQVGMEGLWG